MEVQSAHPLSQETAKLRTTMVFMQRLATIAINRLGGTISIIDEEWEAAEDADMQWRTVRHPTNPRVKPELHVAVTLMNEEVSVTDRDIANLKDEQGGKH